MNCEQKERHARGEMAAKNNCTTQLREEQQMGKSVQCSEARKVAECQLVSLLSNASDHYGCLVSA